MAYPRGHLSISIAPIIVISQPIVVSDTPIIEQILIMIGANDSLLDYTNCSVSVEPFIAVVDEVPPEIV